LSGASMVRAGWLSHGKMVIYPIRPAGADGLQLINWVAEIETPVYRKRDWNRPGSIDDFIGAFADWHFDWLDVPALIRAADSVLEFPMVDQDPLPRWSFGLITLLGDAAHPMVPRGSNGAGQAILDARALTSALQENADPAAALSAYEKQRLEATTRIVLTNRTNPPDAILREVFQRTGDQPMWGIFRPGASSSVTSPGSRLRPAAPPSSVVESKSSCRPRQMPRIGTPAARRSSISSSRPSARTPSIAFGKAPTPGRISPSAARIVSASLAIVAVAPTCSSAFSTERRLPMP